ncbi:MAG: helix-turn-helix domain-containing protein [Coriobacteriia bacterium]|nr:helix-turn-helix domain-containing protein [Coriobacteriia bacterium]
MSKTDLLTDQPDVLNVPDAAKLVGVSPKTLYRLIERGQLQGARIGRRVVVTKAALLRLLGEGE